jgi:predicted Zn-dependent peptidase
MNRLGLISVTGLAVACGSPQTVTRPAPFPTTSAAATPAPTPAPAPKEAPPMQTAQPQNLVFPDEAFRAEQPKAGDPRPFNLPVMKPFTLKSGVKVYLVERHELPLISMELNFDGGSMVDPAGKEGLASVCMDLLTEGTQKLDKLAYSEELADIASSISAYAGSDTQGVSMDTLSKHFDRTFSLFVDTLRSPGFRPTDFDRLSKRRIESIKQAKGNPSAIGGRVTSAVLYGARHPYGAVTTEASLATITVDDCRAYHARWLQPKGARLYVVGDLTEAQIRSAFDSPPIATWTGAAPRAAKLPAPRSLRGKIFFVNVPGAAQSQVTAMHFGPRRTAPDYFANTLMTAIFGGGFTSRINMNLREDKGYSYGARGTFGYSRHYGTFTAGAPVRSDATYQTVLELNKELTRFASDAPPTAEELAREIDGAILGLPGRFATGAASLGMFRSLVYFGLSLDYYTSYVDKVRKLTVDEIKKSAKKHLHPKEAIYVVVGDGAAPAFEREGGKDVPMMRDGKHLTLREALNQLASAGVLGKGAVVNLDADGKIVP